MIFIWFLVPIRRTICYMSFFVSSNISISCTKYARSVQDLLRPTFPGVLRRVRLNYLNMVLYFDQTKGIPFENRHSIQQTQVRIRIFIEA